MNMHRKNCKRVSAFLTAVMSLVALSTAYGKLNVVATLPDYAAVAREIGGDRVEVTCLAKPTEDSHYVDAKPGLILKLNRADVLIEGGAELEAGWLPPLVEGSRNTKLQSGAPGRIVACEGIPMLNVPATVSRAEGDIHAMGNPHFMVDPLRAKVVASHIAASFSKLDPASSQAYDANLKAFNELIDRKMGEWSKALAPFRGQSLVAYHDSWVYFAERFGLKVDIFLEPKPGISPSPSHLANVIEKVRQQHIRAILVEPFHDRKVAESVASHTGAQVVNVTQFPGGIPNTPTYAELIDAIVKRLTAALAAK